MVYVSPKEIGTPRRNQATSPGEKVAPAWALCLLGQLREGGHACLSCAGARNCLLTLTCTLPPGPENQINCPRTTFSQRQIFDFLGVPENE